MNKKLSLPRLAIYLALLIALVFFATPAWFALINSVKPIAEIQAGNVLGLPKVWTVQPWVEAWGTACTGGGVCAGLSKYFTNSLLVVLPATVISTFWACFNGYLLSKWRFRGSDALLVMLMMGIFMPSVLFLLPLSIIFHKFGLSHSIVGLIVVHIIYSIPITLYFRNYFVGFPGELIKAARIDGAGVLSIFWEVVLPTARPILTVVGIMQFTAIWNDFLFALVLSPPQQQLVTVGLNNMTNVQEDVPKHNVYMAGAIIAALPTVIIYVMAGKHFVRGLTSGAVKG